jgi:hypothetical protein
MPGHAFARSILSSSYAYSFTRVSVRKTSESVAARYRLLPALSPQPAEGETPSPTGQLTPVPPRPQ